MSSTLTQKSLAQGAEFPPLEVGKLRLYSTRFCPFAHRARLVLAHKNIPHETVNIDLKKKPEWFLKRNPLGLVPVLEQDDKVICESGITCDYLDEVYPDEPLTPRNPYRRAQDRVLFERFGQLISAFYGVLRSKGENKEALDKLKKYLDMFENTLGERGQFLGGDKPAMADYMIWPWFEIMPLIKAICNLNVLEEFSKLNDWVKNMQTLPAVKETMFDNASHLKFWKSYAAGQPDYDIGLPA